MDFPKIDLYCMQHPSIPATYTLDSECPNCGPNLPDPGCQKCTNESDKWMKDNPLVTFTCKRCGTFVPRISIVFTPLS